MFTHPLSNFNADQETTDQNLFVDFVCQ